MNADLADIMDAYLDCREEEGKMLMKQYIKKEMGFTELGRRTGLGDKNIHRMLSKKGNPTSKHFFLILYVLQGGTK